MLELQIAVIVYAVLLVYLLIIERLLNTVFILFSRRRSVAKGMEAKQVLVAEVDVFSNVFAQALNTAAGCLSYVLSWWLVVLVVVGFFSLLYVAYEEKPDLFVKIVYFYNSNVGPWVANVITVPLFILNKLAMAVIPLWNAGIWFLSSLLSKGVIPIVMANLEILLQLTRGIVNIIYTAVISFIGSVESFECADAVACLQPGAHVVNLITPMGYFKEAVSYSVYILQSLCSLLAAPYDVFLYPLMDMNLALFVHNFFNSVYAFVVTIPVDTFTRCELAAEGTFKVIMCTPDMQPGFQYLVSSFRALGQLTDNWLNIILVILEQVLFGVSATCEQANQVGLQDIMTSSALFPGKNSHEHLVVSGINEWIYAVTDGSQIVYKGHSSAASKIGTWPWSVDVKLGVASVSYSDLSGIDTSAVSDGSTKNIIQTTTLMACECIDTADEGMQIECAFSPMEGWTARDKDSLKSKVIFPDVYIARTMRCAWVDIHVRSVRFSFQRYSSAEVNYGFDTQTVLPSLDCISKQNCREADASIWVLPRCGQDNAEGLANMQACVQGSSCFPYCMGVRLSGAQNNNIVLFSAASWKKGRTLLNQDCNIYRSSVDTVTSSTTDIFSMYGASGTIFGSDISQTVLTAPSETVRQAYSSIAQCYPMRDTISVVPNENFQYTTYNTYSLKQPFVITGDVTFTTVDLGDEVYAIKIDRLESDEKNQFSMHVLSQDFPAEPPLNVPAAAFGFEGQEKIIVPYSTRIGGSVATSSRNYVFYASNPDYGVYAAYFDYCTRDPDSMAKFGLIMKSSYGPIRIYRVKAYAKCGAFSCGAGIIRSVDFDGFRTDYDGRCEGKLNVSVTQLEYVNEENIAVVVSSAYVKDYDSASISFSKYNTTVYWLNPNSMQVSDTIWQTVVPITNYGALCPDMQRLPRVGSFVAEVINAGVYFVQFVIETPLYFPGVLQIWADGGQCPQKTYGHSVLATCGSDLLSLENFFDSMTNAASVFWHSLNTISYMIQIGNTPSSNPVTDILAGMAQYGEGSIDILTIRRSVLTMVNVPFKEQMTSLWASIQDGSIATSMSTFQTNVIVWARFVYKVMVELVLVIVKNALVGNDQTENDIWRQVWNTLFDMRNYYKATVSRAHKLSCAGIKTMLGVTNPWADFAYYICVSHTELIDSMMDSILDITVYIPMVVCVCKESNGHNVADYVTQKCAAKLPLQARPQLFMLAASVMQQNSVLQGNQLCSVALEYSRNKLVHSMDPYFTNMNLALTSFGDVIDYIMIVFDSGAGKCLDFNGNPHIVSIVPQPVDYFQGCGKTTLCKTKCAAEWNLFQEYKSAPVTMPTVSVSYESLFFPGQYDTTQTLVNATAMRELDTDSSSPSGERFCLSRTGPADYVILVAEYSASIVEARVWCIPQAVSATVYIGSATGFPTVTVPGPIMQSFFINDETLCMLLRIGSSNVVYFLDTFNGLYEAAQLYIPSDRLLVNIANIWPLLDTVVIDVVMRKYESSPSEYIAVSYMDHYLLHLDSALWQGIDNLDISTLAGNYMITHIKGDTSPAFTYLLLPRHTFLPAYTLTCKAAGIYTWDIQLTQLQDFDAAYSFPSMFDTVLSSTVRNGVSYVFAVNPSGWDWLQQIRFTVFDPLSQNVRFSAIKRSVSTEIQVTPQGNCDERSCEGCPTLFVQRLCQAYNKCSLVRCVGTLVNQMRPLCAVGQALSFKGSESLQMMQAGWALIAEIIGIIMKLTFSPGNSVDFEWLDDSLTGYICNTKDLIVEFVAIFTSILNSILHLSHPTPVNSFSSSSAIDKNADAAYTIKSTALNSFLAQFLMWPLYMLLMLKQIFSCQVNGILAVFDATGYKVRIQSPRLTENTDIVVGSCLLVSEELAMQNFFVSPNASGVISNVGSFLTNIQSFVSIQFLDIFIHYIDTVITQAIGIVHTLAILLMSMYQSKCNPPDYFLSETVQCACDDYRLTIPASRASEGVDAFALWCSGTLGMIDSTNSPMVIVNPYSYAEIVSKLGGMENYINCISENTECNPPSDPVFERQGVTLINVLVKCRENFLKKQWDPKAYVYFDTQSVNLIPNYYPSPIAPDSTVKTCLIESHQNDAGPGACMDSYIASLGLHTADEYWSYQQALQDGVQFTDACMVFSGPALVHDSPVFQPCVDHTASVDRCPLNAQIWDAVSENDVPVAETHVVQYHSGDHNDLVIKYYLEARETVLNATLEAIYAWGNDTNPDVEVDFFSTEGDAVHQTLDCIFMGPYSRVNYWPFPAKLNDDERIRAPSWYRDDTEGKTRSVDINTCDGGNTMPYTCGSAARRSVIKYFVKDILSSTGRRNNNSTLVKKVVLAELQRIYDEWKDITLFECQCVGSSERGPQCCAVDNQSTWLPEDLRKEFQEIKSENVLDALESEYDNLYQFSMQNPLPWIMYNDEWKNEQYNWNASSQAKDEALLNPREPSYAYENVLTFQSSGAGLWGVCHASLKQVFFTMPVRSAEYTDTTDYDLYNGDPAKLEEFITTIVKEAMQYSPLYRHYNAKYHPSHSLMCNVSSPTVADDTKATSRSAMSETKFDSLIQGTGISTFSLLHYSEILSSNPDASVPRWDYRNMAIGNKSCTCGWPLLRSGLCLVPTERETCIQVCGFVTCIQQCKYDYSLDDTVKQLIDPALVSCPLQDFSLHWGISHADASEAWISGQSNIELSSRDLLKYGRGGARLGNINDMQQNPAAYVNHDSQREVPLDRGRVYSCDYHERMQVDPMKYAEELFPMAQGVAESGVASYCLRYFIERARFTVLFLLQDNEDNLPNLNLTQSMLDQEQLMFTWGKRCGSQLYLLHLCVSLNVFRYAIPGNEEQTRCTYFHIVNHADFYLTPECLVFLDGDFYDPCRCMTCSEALGMQTLDRNFLKATTACKLPFNPIKKATNINAPIGLWSDQEENTDHLHFLNLSLLDSLLDDTDAVGNTNSGHTWLTDEGFMADGHGESCDNMVDYWPDSATFPVGYHVSTVCAASDNSYRSFMNAFSQEYAGTDQEDVYMLYQNDLLRDVQDVDLHFGANGLCRQNNFGMPMLNLNTMVYCTRIPLGEKVDFTVDGFNNLDGKTYEFTDEQCSSTSTQLPWNALDESLTMLPYSSPLVSIGTMPHIPNSHYSNTYPETIEDMFQVGSESILGERENQDCPMYEIYHCDENVACPSEYTCRGMRCSVENDFIPCLSHSDCVNNSGVCLGVCLHNEIHCTKHSDCLDANHMCTGAGKCVQAQIIVSNTHTLNDMYLQFQKMDVNHTNDTVTMEDIAPAYSLIGASYWGYMGPDLLDVHGMCSYSNWYEYTHYYMNQCVSEYSDANVCTLRPDQTLYRDSKVPVVNNTQKWWDFKQQKKPYVMYIRPTNCDRDYERLSGFTFYRVSEDRVSFTIGSKQIINVVSQLHQNYTSAYNTNTSEYMIKLAKLDDGGNTNPERFVMGDVLAGHIGPPNENPFIPCAVVRQCLPAPFTVNFTKTARNMTMPAQRYYNDQDNFICGAIGFFNSDIQKCELDLTVHPIYHLFCEQKVGIGHSCMQDGILTTATIELACASVTTPYDALYSTIQKNVEGLRNMFYMFDNSIATYENIMYLSDCAIDIYAHVKNSFPINTLYWPFEFVLKEFPFDFFYQCILLGDSTNPISYTSRNDQTCAAYQQKSTYFFPGPTTETRVFENYLLYLRGGFSMRDFKQYNATMWYRGMQLISTIKAEYIRNYPDGQDRSYPVCHKYREWRSDLTLLKKSLIYNYYSSSSCQQNMMLSLLKILDDTQAVNNFSSYKEFNETLRVLGLQPTDAAVNAPEKSLLVSHIYAWSTLLSQLHTGNDGDESNWLVTPSRLPVKTLFETLETDMQKMWNVLKTKSSMSFQMNYTIPSLLPVIYDSYLNLVKDYRVYLPDDLLAEESTVSAMYTSTTFEIDETRCAFDEGEDPNIAEGAQCRIHPQYPNLRECGSPPKNCSYIPVFSAVGRFFCHYHYLDLGTVDSNNAYEVYRYMYKLLRDEFVIRQNQNNAWYDSILTPTEFEFFRDTNWQTTWRFDFQEQIDYITNNQPDTSKTVMCVVSDTLSIDYNKCNHPHWEKIKKHAEENYYHAGAVRVQRGVQMHWRVLQSMFTDGFITSYSSSNKTDPTLETYLDNLFDQNKVCKSSYSAAAYEVQSKVCYKFIDDNNIEQVDVINPWMHGLYNPYTMCDIQYTGITPDSTEYVNTYMYDANDQVVAPTGMPYGDQCLSKRNERVLRPGPSRFSMDPLKVDGGFPYNLCHHDISDGLQCMHDQGLLGNDDGLPVAAPDSTYNMFYGTDYVDAQAQYTVASDMYTKSQWLIPDDFHGGLFANTNPLWKGEDAPTGFLKVPLYELGIHRIGITISPPNGTYAADQVAYSTIAVSHLPLTFNQDEEENNLLLSELSSQPVTQWVPLLASSIANDGEQISQKLIVFNPTRDVRQVSVNCPLLRWTVLAGTSPYLVDLYHPFPDPHRTKFLFGHINQNTYAHPTMLTSYSGIHLGKYKTVNGFCFCPVVAGRAQKHCLTPVTETGPCSMDQTVESLRAIQGKWFDSVVLPVQDEYGNTKKCSLPLDWPLVKNTMRDGSVSERFSHLWEKSSDIENQQCHLLDRFKPFQYKYKNSRQVLPTGKNTITSGVCKTGRLTQTKTWNWNSPSVVGRRCVKTGTFSTETTHKCDGDTSDRILPRQLPRTYKDMYDKYKQIKRTKCSQCAKAPRFQTKSGHIMDQESSFGQAYKVSATRVLSNDLRNTLKKANMDHMIDTNYWTESLFLKTYLREPEKLIKNTHLKQPTSVPVIPPPPPAWKTDDSVRWLEKPWVYCSSVSDLINSTCQGTISREQWAQHKTSVCPAMIKSQLQNSQQDAMSHVSFVNIDKYTNKVGLAVQTAREMVIAANCIASGMQFCLPQPFVYHPASYDTTNRAWVHDTVIQYYKRVDNGVCPASEKSQSYVSYLINKQIDCPANNVYIFEGILRIVRMFCTKMAYILTSFVSLLIRLVLSPFSDSAKTDLRDQWRVFVAHFRELIDNMSDLTVNMFMNSGVLGQTLMSFIKSTCRKLNEAAVWFTNVYCTYISKYLVTFMVLFRKFGGSIEFGLKAMQELFEFFLRYYLPGYLLQRYASSAMQAYMLDKFGAPSNDAERNINNKKVVASKPTSKLAQLKMAGLNAFKKVKDLAPTVAKSAAYGVVLMGAMELVNMAFEAQQAKISNAIVDKLWLSNRDIFDFQFLYDAADNVVYFLTNDDTCARFEIYQHYDEGVYLINCPKFDLDPLGSTNPAKSIDATLCWANANPTLGESSMYACTGSSTCCPVTGCSSDKTQNVLCNECPYPTASGISRYACDNMQCKCSVAVQITSQCSANSMCDSSAHCDLISVVSSVSFGTVPCAQCPGEVICILSSTSTSSGRCACLMDKNIETATCYDTPGTIVYPNPNMLCGFAPSISAATSQTSFQYMDIMGVLCSRSTGAKCATVYMPNGQTVSMPVSYQVRVSSGRRRRHMLAIDTEQQDHDFHTFFHYNDSAFYDTGNSPNPPIYSWEHNYEDITPELLHTIMTLPQWNTSAMPCSALAHAYQHNIHMTVLEEYELQKCAYWRNVGRKIIKHHNLTSLSDTETFLVSIDDLASSLVRRNVIWQLLQDPEVILKIMMMHPYFKIFTNVFQYVRQVINTIVHISLTNITTNNAAKSNNSMEDEFITILKQLLQLRLEFLQNQTADTLDEPRQTSTIFPHHVQRPMSRKDKAMEAFHRKRMARSQNFSTHSPKRHHGRHLLVTTSEIEAIQQYAYNIITGKINPPLAYAITKSWTKGPFSWPPRYEYSLSSSCPIITTVKEITVYTFVEVKSFYLNMDKPRVHKPRNLRANAFDFFFYHYKAPDENSTTQVIKPAAAAVVPWASWSVKETLNYLKVTLADIEYFFIGSGEQSMLNLIPATYSCDFAGVMACGVNSKDLLMSFVWFLIYFACLAFLSSAMGFPSLSYAFLLFFPTFVLWYAYGMSPSCFPMVPPCLLEDTIDLIDMFFPVSTTLPAALYCKGYQPNFVNKSTTPICLRPCSDLNFTEWFDPMVYVVCAIDVQTCQSVANLLPAPSGNNSLFLEAIWKPYVVSLHKWVYVVEYVSNADAYIFCTLMTWVQVLPFILLIVLIIMASYLIISSMIMLIPAFVNVLAKIIVFNHTK